MFICVRVHFYYTRWEKNFVKLSYFLHKASSVITTELDLSVKYHFILRGLTKGDIEESFLVKFVPSGFGINGHFNGSNGFPYRIAFLKSLNQLRSHESGVEWKLVEKKKLLFPECRKSWGRKWAIFALKRKVNHK